MYHFFISSSAIHGSTITITGPDVNHIRNVLRLRCGETILVSDERQTDYRCAICQVEADGVTAAILETEAENHELPSRIHLFQGLPKADKMEWIIQKAVELGVYRIIPVSMKNCVVKLDEKKAAAKVRRWNAISESAAKQSKRSLVPEISAPLSFSEALSLSSSLSCRLMAYEHARGMAAAKEALSGIRPGMDIGVWIGPEGGFSPEEAAQAAKEQWIPISLGKRILRTETAGITLLSILMFHLETEECI